MPTLDAGPVTVTCPPWCAGHPEGPAEYLVDVHHAAPVPVPAGLVKLDVQLVEYPYGATPIPVSLHATAGTRSSSSRPWS
ncbi:DUF6907 domain-containing protein [Streptomyces sp. NPDC098789]|uniref:DUF6907 domain-containing protein n=1 Tax=Streptomyces sp. NPDC098789 TaxID=3366098 RepID=UPI0037FA05A6